MEVQTIPTKTSRTGRQTGDPKSAFRTNTAAEILAIYGPPRRLLGTSTKLLMCDAVGVLSRILYLPPGLFCPAAEGCLFVCNGHNSGRMAMPSSVSARDRRAALYLEDQQHFLTLLRADLYALRNDALLKHLIPAARLNGSSDILWERLHGDIFREFPDVAFYDYTKLSSRMWHFLGRGRNGAKWPTNYHLTFSLSESNQGAAKVILGHGGNVAVVFDSEMPKEYLGHPVIDGNVHDARFLDASGVIVGLSAKGRATMDQSGFVKRPTVS